MVALNAFQVVRIKVAVQLSSLLIAGTVCSEEAGITGGRIGTVLHLLGLVLGTKPTQRLPSRTEVAILSRAVGELGGPIQRAVFCAPSPARACRL